MVTYWTLLDRRRLPRDRGPAAPPGRRGPITPPRPSGTWPSAWSPSTTPPRRRAAARAHFDRVFRQHEATRGHARDTPARRRRHQGRAGVVAPPARPRPGWPPPTARHDGLIQQGAVRVDGRGSGRSRSRVRPGSSWSASVIQVGRRRFLRIIRRLDGPPPALRTASSPDAPTLRPRSYGPRYAWTLYAARSPRRERERGCDVIRIDLLGIDGGPLSPRVAGVLTAGCGQETRTAQTPSSPSRRPAVTCLSATTDHGAGTRSCPLRRHPPGDHVGTRPARSVRRLGVTVTRGRPALRRSCTFAWRGVRLYVPQRSPRRHERSRRLVARQFRQVPHHSGRVRRAPTPGSSGEATDAEVRVVLQVGPGDSGSRSCERVKGDLGDLHRRARRASPVARRRPTASWGRPDPMERRRRLVRRLRPEPGRRGRRGASPLAMAPTGD